ncbi:cephalosporin-C deacetylase [Lentzea albidocapillata subsp. violacea]|uniref:Cephalosporin-C deacetylase n=1 Tax=Lentzea albidocapillata subsp. violacea TaxID=128104 RepID=A0A1G8PTK5_9PSEU|nr:acetylxylan esterase [Lentzea albidocapillata]SDI95678.1 cephalosporin-C deacetylase [Lentzea albidocapillata subsp. violacea]
MPLTDAPLDELVVYRPETQAPPDFDEFWERTLAEARSAGGVVEAADVTDRHLLRTVEVADVRFPGFGGEPVAAWLLRPRGSAGPLPVVITYIGYSGGRGLPTDHLLWSAAGYAQLVVDSRGQGHDTPDRTAGGTQWAKGFMTRGIDSPDDYYYRRLITDCVRAVDAVGHLPGVDPERVVVAGGSQGGGLTIAVAGLARDRVAAALPDVPFLCHFRRGAELCGEGPYVEIAEYLRWHSRHGVEPAFTTLSYFDGVHFAQRATAPALFSVGLMDPICPPSTVYAAFNHYAGEDRTMTVWPFADHGGGYGSNPVTQLEWLRDRALAP